MPEVNFAETLELVAKAKTREEKRQIRRKIVNLHPTREICFHIRETIGKRKGQL